jgi:hypothetical protein
VQILKSDPVLIASLSLCNMKASGVIEKLTITEKISPSHGITKKQLTFENKPSGLYMVMVMLDGKVGTAKLIRMR